MSRCFLIIIASAMLLLSYMNYTYAFAADVIDGEVPQTHKSFLGLTLEKSTLNDVKSVFGYSEPWSRNDQKHDPFIYCYKLADPEKNVWILLSFGWAWSFERIDAVTITLNKDDIEGKVFETPISAKTVMTDGGLKLGLSVENARNLIPNKPRVRGNIYEYNFEKYVRNEKPIKPQGDDGFTYVGEYRYGTIDFTVEGNEIVRFHIWASGEPDW